MAEKEPENKRTDIYDERFFQEALLKLLKAPFPAFELTSGINPHVKDITPEAAGNRPEKGRAGSGIIMTGYAGESGAAVLYEEKKAQLLTRYSPYYLEKYPLNPEWTALRKAAGYFEEKGLFYVCAGIGGVFGALYRISKELNLGFTVDMKKIPIRQQTVEIMNTLGGNPYELYSAGVVLGICDETDMVLSELKAKDIPAALLGRLEEGRKKILIRGEEERFLERPRKYFILEGM